MWSRQARKSDKKQKFRPHSRPELQVEKKTDMIIDTHAHYDSEDFDQDREILIESFPGKGIEKVLNAGASAASAWKGLEMAERWPQMYCALGVHPNELEGLSEEVLKEFAEKSGHPKVAAIGEIGLEYHYEEPPRDVQKIWFRRQIALAKEVGLPIIVHSRDAVKDTLDVIREEHAEEAGGVIHCFSAGPEVAEIYVRMGFYIGVGGVVTFKNGRKLKEVVQAVPMDRILLETDAPYLAPVPHRGHRNSSLFLPLVAEAVAELRGISRQEVIDITRENALRCFPKLAD